MFRHTLPAAALQEREGLCAEEIITRLIGARTAFAAGTPQRGDGCPWRELI
jgi:hypothetical protein